MNHSTTRVFLNGNSQAVRIPAEFRLDTDRVRITRTEQGDLLLHPLRKGRGTAFLEALKAFDDLDEAFLRALESRDQDQPPMQDREGL